MSPQTDTSRKPVAEQAVVIDDVRRIVAEISGISPTAVRDDQTLSGDLAWDSLDVVECAMEIEENFDVSVPEELMDEVHAVRDVIDGVLRLLADR